MGATLITPSNVNEFVAGMQSWNDARMDCQATEDGDLLIINSQAELDYISGVKQNISGSWWIGR